MQKTPVIDSNQLLQTAIMLRDLIGNLPVAERDYLRARVSIMMIPDGARKWIYYSPAHDEVVHLNWERRGNSAARYVFARRNGRQVYLGVAPEAITYESLSAAAEELLGGAA